MKPITAAVLAAAVLLAVAPSGVAQPVAPMGPTLQPADLVFYWWGGHRYCWYDGGWRGPGWYWCGSPWRRGFGWGGPWGWHGWVGGHPGRWDHDHHGWDHDRGRWDDGGRHDHGRGWGKGGRWGHGGGHGGGHRR